MDTNSTDDRRAYDDYVRALHGKCAPSFETWKMMRGLTMADMASALHPHPVPPTLEAQLKVAILRFTAQAPDAGPSNRAEFALAALCTALDLETWPEMDEAHRALIGPRLTEANAAAADVCRHLADDVKALREAATAYFGADFADPAAPRIFTAPAEPIPPGVFHNCADPCGADGCKGMDAVYGAAVLRRST